MRMPDGGVAETFYFTDFKQDYINLVNGKTICKMQANQNGCEKLARQWQGGSSTFSAGWYGCSSDQMISWFRNGYKVEGMTLIPPIVPVRKRRRLQYGEEGELQLDLMRSGHDYPFLDWTRREIIPGMKIDIEIGSLAEASIVAQGAYYRWVLRALIALEGAGVDLEIWLTSRATGVLARNSNATVATHFQVKREGEMNDYLTWSAVFSPGSHRHLTFLARHLAADRNGLTASGVGGSRNTRPYSVSYDPETRTLNIYSPNNAKHFPEEEMDIELRDVLLQARRAVA